MSIKYCVVDREVLGWRIIRITEETWKRIVVRQMKSEIIDVKEEARHV